MVQANQLINPIGFTLYYKNYVNLNTIYLDDGYPALPLYLEFFNLSDQEIQLSAPPANSARNTVNQCHFYLRIPQGVLKIADPSSIISNDNWQVVYVPASTSSQSTTSPPPGGATPPPPPGGATPPPPGGATSSVNTQPGAVPGYDTIYISRNTARTITANNPTSPEDSSSKIILILNQIHAASGVQTKSSSISLNYGGLTAYKSLSASLPSAAYSHDLFVVNHVGKKNLPLYASFVGSNTILNDGSANKLTLQITNIRDKNNSRPNLIIGKNSRFIISFEDDDSTDKSKEWALAESDQIKAIEITTRNITGGSLTDEQQQKLDDATFTYEQQQAMNAILQDGTLTPEEKNQLESDIAKLISLGERMPFMASGFGEYFRNINWSVECLIEIKRLNSLQEGKFFDGYVDKQPNNTWILKPTLVGTGKEQVPKKGFLRPGEIIELDITNITSYHPSGQTQLTIRYEEIPNYWDGYLSCIIEKTPLMYHSPLKATMNNETLSAVRIKTDFDDNQKSGVKHVGLAVENGDLTVGSGDLAVGSGALKTKWATISNSRPEEATFSHQNRATTTDYALSQESSGTTILNAASGQQIRFNINNSPKLCIDSSGYLGIGTNNPSEKLEVAGDIKTNSALIARAIGDGSAEWMRLSHRALGNQTKYALAQEGGGQTYLNGGTIRFRINNSDRMYLSSRGYLGIGTINPSDKLEVNGNIKTNSALIGSQRDGWAGFSHKNQGYTSGGFGLLQNSSGGTLLNAASGQQISFTINSSDKMILDQYGNLGIGTTIPSTKLQVNGAIRAQSLSLDDSANVLGAIYVHHVPVWDGSGAYDMTWNKYTKQLSREGSSLRYKKNVTALADDFSKILQLEPKQYEMKEECGGQGDLNFGYIAEELDQLGLSNLVTYDESRQPDGIKYKKMCIYLLEVLKDLNKKVDILYHSSQSES